MKIALAGLALGWLLAHAHVTAPKCYDPNTNTPINCSLLK